MINTGRLQWIIPAVPTSSNCYLRYTVASAGDTVVAVTPRPFTIISRSFIRSDASCDGGTDLSDAASLLAHLFLWSQPPCCLDAADAGTLEIIDAIYSLSSLFLGGLAPPAPFPECGIDPTIHDLDCVSCPGCP